LSCGARKLEVRLQFRVTASELPKPQNLQLNIFCAVRIFASGESHMAVQIEQVDLSCGAHMLEAH
jgi:hypothetical protein